MIIRLGKFEAFIVLTLTVTASFIFALTSENKTAETYAQKQSVSLPVIMYHHVTRNSNRAGKYTLLVEEFENDLEYIKNNGYTTVTVNDIISYVKGEGELPQKPVMITFDDGFESFYELAFPIIKKHNMKAVVSVIGSVTEKYSSINDHNINYSNLTWTEITELNESGIIEIQNHSYDMHSSANGERKGISKMKSETEAEYKKALSGDLLKLQELLNINCGFTPSAVAYPFGAYSKSTLKIIKDCGFQCSFTCEERINLIERGNTESLFNLGRFNRESGISTKSFFEKLK